MPLKFVSTKRVLQVVAAVVVAVILLGAISSYRSRIAMHDWMDYVQNSTRKPSAQQHMAPTAAPTLPQPAQMQPFALRDGEECRGESPGWPGVVVRAEVRPDGSKALAQVIENGRIVSCMAGRRLH